MRVFCSACSSNGKGHEQDKSIQLHFSHILFWQGVLSGLLCLVGEGVKMALEEDTAKEVLNQFNYLEWDKSSNAKGTS